MKNRLTRSEKLILEARFGRKVRSRSVGRICQECNAIVDGGELFHCDDFKRTVEFRSRYLRRFPRERAPVVRVIPKHVVDREYSAPHAQIIFTGRTESNRTRF